MSNNDSFLDKNQAQSLAALLMAVKEVNANQDMLPNYDIQVVVRYGDDGFAAAISVAQKLLNVHREN